MAEINQWQEPNSTQQLQPFDYAGKSYAASHHLDGLYVCDQRFRQRRDLGNTCPTLTNGKSSARLTTPSAPPSCSTRFWRSHATEAEIAAGLISPLEAHGNEAADKLAARGALRNALSMEYVVATRSTDLRVRLVQTRLVEINLLHVQNRTKTVYAKAKAPESRAKFDPAEAMCQLNRIGHDFSRVQVGKGRFTYKCRLCFLRGERSFLKQLLDKPCSATSSRLHSHT